ncbi:hypothetical protein ECG_08638 [Echinococcus granulosus]|nr:hypothetical protein ECG_08638 [Echinococcus granulosus]
MGARIRVEQRMPHYAVLQVGCYSDKVTAEAGRLYCGGVEEVTAMRRVGVHAVAPHAHGLSRTRHRLTAFCFIHILSAFQDAQKSSAPTNQLTQSSDPACLLKQK